MLDVIFYLTVNEPIATTRALDGASIFSYELASYQTPAVSGADFGRGSEEKNRPFQDIRRSASFTVMLLILGTVRLPPELLDPARREMARMISASRAEDGCEEYCYAEDVLEPGLIHVKELWRDQVALDRHFSSEHIAAWRSTWPALGITDRNLRVYDVGQPRAT